MAETKTLIYTGKAELHHKHGILKPGMGAVKLEVENANYLTSKWPEKFQTIESVQDQFTDPKVQQDSDTAQAEVDANDIANTGKKRGRKPAVQ